MFPYVIVFGWTCRPEFPLPHAARILLPCLPASQVHGSRDAPILQVGRSSYCCQITLAYEKDRAQTMKENMSRLTERLKENAGDTGGLQDFSSIARYFVYGHAQQGRQPQEQEIDSDLDYEPDDVEEADTEYEIVIAEEENTQANSSSEAVVGSTMAQQKKGIQKVLQELERIMYIISDVLASPSRSKRKRFEAGKFEFSNDDLNARLAAQQEEIEHFRMKHQEEIEAIMKAQEAKNLAFKKRLQNMDAIFAYFLRMTAQSSQHNYRPTSPS